MMRTVIYTMIVVIQLLINVAITDAVNDVIGMQADATFTAPAGSCTSFNMTSGGNIVLPESTMSLWGGIGEAENNYGGFGYLYSLSGTNIGTLYQYALDTVALTGKSVGVDSGGVPDAINSNQASRYNTFTSRWANIGLASGVMHVRTYNGGVLASDINTGLSVSTIFSTSGYDSSFTFLSIAASSNNWLYVMNTGPYTLAQSTTVGATQLGGDSITSDATYIYGLINPGTIKRFLKSNISTNSVFTPISGATSITGITQYNGFLYTTAIVGGNAVIHKISTSTMASVANIVYGAVAFGSPLIDTVNNKIYVPSRSSGTSQLIRINLNTFTNEATYNGLNSTNGTLTRYTMLDTSRQWVFMESMGGGGFQSRVERVNLCG